MDEGTFAEVAGLGTPAADESASKRLKADHDDSWTGPVDDDSADLEGLFVDDSTTSAFSDVSTGACQSFDITNLSDSQIMMMLPPDTYELHPKTKHNITRTWPKSLAIPTFNQKKKIPKPIKPNGAYAVDEVESTIKLKQVGPKDFENGFKKETISNQSCKESLEGVVSG
mmetsp:Transcript_54966/g.98794  ORF Transcript_54966/g.98794 Transcript_54966/m.98794 type:complete len:170 (+) Transcript_54966:51-560(+)